MNKDLDNLKQQFLKKWPLERVQNMTLTEYTNLNKSDSFCYWLESVTTELGSIWGGSAYKFGIYRRSDTSKDVTQSYRKTDGEYAWYIKYGNTKDEAFSNIKNHILSIIKNVRSNNLSTLDAIDLGTAYKWKIAFLYSNYNVLNIFSDDKLKAAAEMQNIHLNKKERISDLHSKILNNKPEHIDYYTYTQELWDLASDKNEGLINQMTNEYLMNNSKSKNSITTNKILYGPPGTGKTYKTKKLAVELIDNKIYGDNEDGRQAILERYNELYKKDQIVFTTFHQSMGYEDFVEGIKPKTEDGRVTYEVEDGIFKTIANRAKGINGKIISEGNAIDFKSKNYFKMSIGGKNRKDVHDWCIKNDYIALGYGSKNDLSPLVKLSKEDYWNEFPKQFPDEFEGKSFSRTATSSFIYSLKKGDIVLVSLGNHIIDAIGIVEGEYEYKELEDVPYHHFRKVKWLGTNLDADPKLFIDKNISQQTIYQFNNYDVKVEYLEQTFGKEKETIQHGDYVLIIDEINRGNVSAIFGELITLLEPDKRLGKEEALTITLPYSKTKFGVPANLHIIGTMNTADRSVEALDTALRRRFEFMEMMPDISHLEDKEIEGINLGILLKTINERIEILLDRDHTIGHSYFLNVNDKEELVRVFANQVVPLLQEYFYGDYGKIGLILGNGFIKEREVNKIKFANFSYDNQGDINASNYSLKEITSDNIMKAVSETLGIKVQHEEKQEASKTLVTAE